MFHVLIGGEEGGEEGRGAGFFSDGGGFIFKWGGRPMGEASVLVKGVFERVFERVLHFRKSFL